MQKDEDVGKVAQATPILICECINIQSNPKCTKTFFSAKALELFMAELATKSADKATEHGAKKVEPWHLCVPPPN